MEFIEIINIIIVPVISLFGWILKSLVTGIKKEVFNQTKKFEELIKKFTQFEIIISHVQKDLENSNKQQSKIEDIIQLNSNKINSNTHEISCIKESYKELSNKFQIIEDKLIDLEKELISFKGTIQKK